ncbi:hypothetical protein OKA04_04670 [Luteolibacter flavescens]|uniref:Uncharacterized protein n=1 Tax=Luteolibacter flavescens TaxID=1859460 RepID=A0ABT3FKC8_9BACT|nr:hypothetical protein [Luteolibacter flavescens]MCW1884010.1 hypothetical protein [Luteolibacter flavescens]
MNTALAIFPEQSNTQEGPFQVLAGENLTGLAGRVVKLTHDTGKPEVQLPNDVHEEADYLLLDGGPDGSHVTVIALSRDRNVRVRLDGTCNPGDKLTLAAINGANDGKVRTVPATADTYWVFLRAEEKGVDEQLVLCRLLPNPGPQVVA